jgi:hypothetical protein
MSEDPEISRTEASSTLLRRALKHLVEKCETHDAVCPYKEESLRGLINFCQAVLQCDAGEKGMTQIKNLEWQVITLRKENRALIRMIYLMNQMLIQNYEGHFLESVQSMLDQHCCCPNECPCHSIYHPQQ